MSNGMHPFGEGVKRQLNILSYEFDLKLFNDPNVLDSNGVLAQELIADMIRKEPIKRPSAKSILSHPFFWNAEKILNFLQVGISHSNNVPCSMFTIIDVQIFSFNINATPKNHKLKICKFFPYSGCK